MSKWKLEGYDTFEGEPYPLPGEFDDQKSAEKAAGKRLKKLEISQPKSSSGGQDSAGIQDRVYIIRPDGSKYRYTG